MKYLIGIDVGTSGTKAVLFDTDGKAISSCTEEYPLIQPKVGWAEQDPHDWWNAVQKALTKITADVDKSDIAGLGLTGQMHGLVMLDGNGEVITNAIIWCDGRTTEECREIESIIGKERLIEITANPALEGFTAGKIMWQKKHAPEAWAKCRHILLPKDYIRYKLTGDFATDVSDASGMQLMDIKGRCWSEEVCKKLGVDMALLPKLYESPEITGGVSEAAAKLTGLPAGLPVCAVLYLHTRKSPLLTQREGCIHSAVQFPESGTLWVLPRRQDFLSTGSRILWHRSFPTRRSMPNAKRFPQARISFCICLI